MTVSNGVFFTVIEVPPLQDVGWEVRVVSYTDFLNRAVNGGDGAPLAVISTFEEVTISPEISDVGQGSITMDLDAEFWRNQLSDGNPATMLRDYEHVWQVFEDGLLRFEFLGQDVDEAINPQDETRTVTISGPGIAAALKWGKVMTPQYPYAPKPAPSTEIGVFQFTRISLMGAWLQLLAACKKRRTDEFITPTFTALVDSYGDPWADNYVFKPVTVGTTLTADVLFDTDQYALKPAATATLSNLVNSFNTLTPVLTVVGHTDSRASYAHNMTLSINRANAVANYIKSLVPGAVITVIGKGETQPVATNRTAAGQQKNRRVVITYTPTDEIADEIIYEPTLGADLLTLLKENCGLDPADPSPIRAEWYMRPNFQLDVVQRGFGTHREADVVFYEGSVTTIGKSRARNREPISNLIAIQNDYGDYSIATSATSIAHWGQREKFARQNTAYDDTMRGQIATKNLELSKDELSTWTIAVPPYAAGRRVFQDFHLGDWIGISQYHGSAVNTVEPFRVLAITLKVDKDSQVELELTLQSKQESRFKKLQEQITSILDHLNNGTKVYISDDEPTGATIGDLWTPKTTS